MDMKYVFLLAAMVGLVLSRQPAKAQDAGISGKWHFMLDTEDGIREVDAEFTADADGKVTGKFARSDVAGTFKDGKLELSFLVDVPESGGSGTLKLSGKLSDPAGLTGSWEFTEYNGTFKANRQK